MARTRKDHGFTALRIEGGILPPEFLQSIAALEAPRQTGTAYSLSKSLVLKEELARYWRIANDLYTSYSESRPRRELSADQVGVGECYEKARGVASALVLANMNSLPLDWIVRFSVGGVNMNFFIVKQLPVLPPETYLEEALSGLRYVELIVPRVLELTYTAHDLEGFARDLGYDGPPFAYDDDRRHCLKCELDAIFAHLYQLDRADLEWILDAPEPSASFPALKRNEMQEFGEYRTQRYVLHAYDQLARGELPDLTKSDEV